MSAAKSVLVWYIPWHSGQDSQVQLIHVILTEQDSLSAVLTLAHCSLASGHGKRSATPATGVNRGKVLKTEQNATSPVFLATSY